MSDIEIIKIDVGHENRNGGILNDWHHYPNSAGGVSVRLKFRNLTQKTIKYIRFYFVPYNKVGDAVSSRIANRVEMAAKSTGPYHPGQRERAFWENLWYNHSIKSVKITKIEIEFMGGSKQLIPGDQIQSPQPRRGCYVATAVYGSYDCPEVWSLRRFRDHSLSKTWYGRAFIHIYYTVSPILLKLFGNQKWFTNFAKKRVDSLVRKLKNDGVENTPYDDIDW